MGQFEYIARQLMIVAGVIMIVFGLFGNILNILVFTNWSRSRTTRNNQLKKIQTSNSPLYLLTSSIANFTVIAYAVTTRILFDGYQYPVTQNNMVFLCKLRFYCLHTFDTISWVCLCMAMFDRYLVSSREVRLRQLSRTRQETKIIILFIICLIGLHSIPIANYYDVSKFGQCIIYSTSYLYYYRYTFQIFLHGIIPIIIFSILGFLTFTQLKMIRNIQNINKNINVDKQLSRMFLLMSITIVLSSIPYTVENIYYLIFADSSQQQTSYVFFFHILSSILFYTNAVWSFYVYYISTPNFRMQVQKIIFCKKDLNRFMNNQIHTITTLQ
ncbi:unnamed protein product [Rotaria sordida]|uniref:G-protein coupled receptors family 1 profile domain-containing protein n=1 Tax=Rotaria sordida TaxID=392033 RepID=A0A819T1R7_9BILA|nr:unnamed protein product [Rotaria sordida]CAF1156956.1 unnamed protein product [Rotaria sordida]CAF4008977.1 unnamed protein product [Rotaria sordida]CAF4059399.1 unnamed protein product [Rotaria sordida]